MIACPQILVCPETKQKLTLCTLSEAEQKIDGKLAPLRIPPSGKTKPSNPAPFGITPYVLLRADNLCAYPIVDGIPILLSPELLGARHRQSCLDLESSKYAEPYEEMEHYNAEATRESHNLSNLRSYERIKRLLLSSPEQRAGFPNPSEIWLDGVHDCASQWDAYRHLAPIRDKRVLQLGGKGLHAVRFLLAGAREAWLLSPMIDELRFAATFAGVSGVLDRLHCVCGVAEEIPFPDDSFDVVFSHGSLHHTVVGLALLEVSRILVPSGKFSAVEPWLNPQYKVGTRIFGKRMSRANCRPLSGDRMAVLSRKFTDTKVLHHGALIRYPLIVLNKCGLPISLQVAWRLNQIDDMLSSLFPGFGDRFGGSVAVLGIK
jgi:uncharacterized protein YbaR (Trm112 family)